MLGPGISQLSSMQLVFAHFLDVHHVEHVCCVWLFVSPRVFKRYIKIRATSLNVTFYLDSCIKITLHCLTEMLLARKWS